MLTNWRQGKADNSFPLVCGTIGEWFYMTQIVGIGDGYRKGKNDARKHKDRVNKNTHKSNMEAFRAIIGADKGKSKGEIDNVDNSME